MGSKDQIENMVNEAEKYKEQDEAKRDLIEERNRVESQIHETEKQLDNFKDQLEQSKVDEIKGKIEELQKVGKIIRFFRLVLIKFILKFTTFFLMRLSR